MYPLNMVMFHSYVTYLQLIYPLNMDKNGGSFHRNFYVYPRVNIPVIPSGMIIGHLGHPAISHIRLLACLLPLWSCLPQRVSMTVSATFAVAYPLVN
jgi:hypothetical protein